VSLSLSADDRRIAVSSNTGSNRDIWVLDQMTGSRSRLTFDPGSDDAPIWSRDGQTIVFGANRSGRPFLLQKQASGTAGEERLLDDGDVRGAVYPTDWSADGRYLLYERTAGLGALTDVWVLPLFGDRKPFPYLQAPASESDATFSPDGKWVAYQSASAESGNVEVFVQPFPATGGKFQVSQGGGAKPVWRRDGRELFFLSSDARMMAAAVDNTGGGFNFGPPVPLFSVTTVLGTAPSRQYAVSPDGTRFLVNVAQQTTANVPLTVVVNWLSAVQR
jgi:Tol biopolymer transport system component